jgi:hypothetical protein
MGRLTGRMAETLDCDILLVKEPVPAASIRASKSGALWQGAFGD